MPSKKGTKKNIDKRITAKLYRFPKAFRRKTNKKRPKSKSSSPKKKSPSPNECPICLEPFTPNNLAILDCGHKFHFRCILKDVTKSKANKQCPLCRARVDSSPVLNQNPPISQRLQNTLDNLGLQVYYILGVRYYIEPDERILYDDTLNDIGNVDEEEPIIRERILRERR
jgi:hypothetical protein